MYSIQDVLAGVKSLFGAESDEELSHCQKLDLYSRKLDFQGFQHLKKTLKGLPYDELITQGDVIMRSICSMRLPCNNQRYYEYFIEAPLAERVYYYSRKVGQDIYDCEIREPKPLNGLERVKDIRGGGDSLYYLLGSETEVLSWMSKWGGKALVPESIVKRVPYLYECFKECKVPDQG